MDDNQLLIRSIFFPYVDEKTKEALETQSRFVYYTTAETAFRILGNEEIWMRNTGTMNDFLEIEHGFACLNEAYKSESGKLFKDTLNSIFPDMTTRVEKQFNDWLPSIRGETFITCLSEHLLSEDMHGRLSMWRAYGGRSGVAVVINGDTMFLDNENIGVFGSPVAYFNQKQVEDEFRRISERIKLNEEFIKTLQTELIERVILMQFVFAALCTKHPGFAEEREWRIVAMPYMYDSPLLTQAVEIINGVPQILQKLKLMRYAEVNLDIEPKRLVDRIIIGPCEYPIVIYRALKQALANNGVEHAENKIFISDIPLRTNVQ